jgi:hypothetical protein
VLFCPAHVPTHPQAACSARVLGVAALLVGAAQATSVRRAAVALINRLPSLLLLPRVPQLLPVLRLASGDLDDGVRAAAADAVRKLSPLRAQAVRAAAAAAAAAAAGRAPPPPGLGGGGAEELRLSLRAFEAAAPMHDPKRPWRKLASHPVNLAQVAPSRTPVLGAGRMREIALCLLFLFVCFDLFILNGT